MTRKEKLSYFLLLLFIYAALFGWKQNLIGRFFSAKVSGRVIDISVSAPVEMVSVRSGPVLTHTNYEGQFVMTAEGRQPLRVLIETPNNYESGSEEMRCKSLSEKFLERSFFCETLLFPRPFEIASRVLNDEKAIESQNRKEREDRKISLWNRSSAVSQQAFGQQGDFVYLLVLKEEIDIKKEVGLKGFEVDEDSTILGSYFDPIAQKDLTEVAEVTTRRYFADGSVRESKEHFVKEDGIWHYLIPFSRRELVDFVTQNEWVLKVKK